MTKTKRQLRAEAVERLKNSEYHTALDDVCSMLGWGHEPHFEGATDALIDLLTDDDANDDSTPEKVVRTASVDANDVKVSTMPLEMPSEIRWHYMDGSEYTQELTGDSREKLEADIYRAADEMEKFTHGEQFINVNKILRWLDRQAAITEREVCAWIRGKDAEHDERIHRVAELQQQVDELTAERDELKAEIAKYEHDCGLLFDEKHKLTADAKRWADAANSQRLVAMEQADKVQELTAERDELKADLIAERGKFNRKMNALREVTRDYRNERDHYRSKFGKCLDYADAIHALMDEGMA